MFLTGIIMIYCTTKALNGISAVSGVNGLVSQVDRIRVGDLMFCLGVGCVSTWGLTSISAHPRHFILMRLQGEGKYGF